VRVATPVAASAVASSSEFQEFERVQPTFAVGDSVRIVAASTDGHTRCPAYLRGAVGSIEKVHSLAHFPEVCAHTSLRCREHTYAVTFDAHALWPDDPASVVGHSVIVEVFESYMKSVSDE
jgi:nitrile hydratase subunit beta